MNELVQENQNGILIGRWQRATGDADAPVIEVTVQDVEIGMQKVLMLSLEQRKTMGKYSRVLYLQERAAFHEFLRTLDSAVCKGHTSLETMKHYMY